MLLGEFHGEFAKRLSGSEPVIYLPDLRGKVDICREHNLLKNNLLRGGKFVPVASIVGTGLGGRNEPVYSRQDLPVEVIVPQELFTDPADDLFPA